MDKGISKNVAEKAIYKSKGAGVQIAMMWIEKHREDADFEE